MRIQDDSVLEDTCCTVPPDSKKTKLGKRDQETSPSAGKNTGVYLVPCRAWKCVPTAISVDVDISEVPGYHVLRVLSEGHKITSRIGVS